MSRFAAPFIAAAMICHAAAALAQSAFGPPPGAAPATGAASPFPAVNGAAPSASFGAPGAFPSQGAAPIPGGAPPVSQQAGPPGGEECMKGFLPLRQETERRGNLIKAAGERRASPDEACKLIGSFSQAEIKMMKYVELNAKKCGIPPQISEQLKAGHKNTETMQGKVCNAAKQMQARGPAGPSLSEVLGSSSALPEAAPAKRGGSTFDTLNGNVLTR